MDYIKVRKWLRFYEREEVDAVTAVYLIAFYLGRLKELPFCYEEGVCADGFTCVPSLCPKVDLDDVK